jgi:hypothetical protein
LNNNKIATAEKLLRENNHEYFVNQDWNFNVSKKLQEQVRKTILTISSL